MDQGNVESVLRCQGCHKPFDKESTLRRHGYYCRSRGYVRVSRTRSCMPCAKRKARCDNQQPACSRCKTKATQCHYPANAPKGAASKSPRTPHGDDDKPTEGQGTTSSFGDSSNADHGLEAGPQDDALLGNALTTSVSDPTHIEAISLGWDDISFDVSEFLNMPENHAMAGQPSLVSPNLLRASTSSAEKTSYQDQQLIAYPNLSIPAQLNYNVRLFTERPKMQAGTTHRTARLILHTLKSYALMTLRHENALPPFIHPHLISHDVGDRIGNDMEPLNNCISLVHMLASRVPGSRKLFWKNVRMECERLYAEHLQLNKWELLAAMQALSIYIIIRLDEGQTEHNNFDSVIITLVKVLAERLAITGNTDVDNLNWKNWIFEESKRRLCVVYRVVDLLFYFEPAAMCRLHEIGLVIAPLPAKKQLWEAGDEITWKAQSERDDGAQQRHAFALAATGELVKLPVQQGPDICRGGVDVLQFLYRVHDADPSPLGSPANWDEWCSGMDGLGGLIMLAASLTE